MRKLMPYLLLIIIYALFGSCALAEAADPFDALAAMDQFDRLSETYVTGDETFTILYGTDSTIAIEGLYFSYEMPDDGNLVIPDHLSGTPVVQIFDNAFSGNEQIVGVSLPSGITRIRQGAFCDMPWLSSVSFPDGLKQIDAAFCRCPNLLDVYIPKSVTTIAEGAFSGNGDSFRLIVEKGSAAEKFARDNNISFINPDDLPKPVSVEPGNIVTFGSVDGEPIEWYVLESDGTSARLLAKDVIGSFSFDSGKAYWSDSSVYTYLNDVVRYSIFDSEDEKIIQIKNIDDPIGPYALLVVSGNTAPAALHLLSYYEMLSLLPSEEYRAASDAWWLRTSYEPASEDAHYVNADGSHTTGYKTYEFGMRPAVWIDTTAAGDVVKVINSDVWPVQEEEPPVEGIQPGALISFGRYEQDGNSENGPEPLHWRILSCDAFSATLITEYCIDTIPYNSGGGAAYWDETSSRSWLNADFLTTAFTPQEQAMLHAMNTTCYDMDGGASRKSVDMVTFLNMNETEYYFPTASSRHARLTNYAYSRGASCNAEGYGHWMLRTDKNSGGKVYLNLPYRDVLSTFGDRSGVSVRPVVKLNLVSAGLAVFPGEDYIEDWDNPIGTVYSGTKSTVLDSRVMNRVLCMQNTSGGSFAMVAPEDGDYIFTVLCPEIGYSSFSMNVSVAGEARTPLHFYKSGDKQLQAVTGVKAGDVIAWYDDDNSGYGSTMLSPYKLMISCGSADEMGIVPFEYAEDWEHPYTTLKSSKPSTGIGESLMGKVLRMENAPGGFYSFVAPADGDYLFTVKSPWLQRESFIMEVNVADRQSFSLYFEKSDELQTEAITDVKAGEVITWWDNDNSGNWYTMVDPYLVKINHGSAQSLAPVSEPGFSADMDGMTVEAGDELTLVWGEVKHADAYFIEITEIDEYGYDVDYIIWGDPIYPDDGLTYTVPRSTLIHPYYRITLTAKRDMSDDPWSGEEFFSQSITINVHDKFAELESADSGADSTEDNASETQQIPMDALIESGHFTYYVQEDGTACVIAFDRSSSSVDIPSSIDGLTVTAVGDGFCAWSFSTLTSVHIPGTVRVIGSRAFEYTDIVTVTIDEGVEIIGDNAFAMCHDLESINFASTIREIGDFVCNDCENLYEAALPSGLTSLGRGAFVGCTSLTAAAIPGSLTDIPEGAFVNCISLRDLTLGEGVVNIGDFAFHGCESLTSVNMPSSVATIGKWAFAHCSSLSSVQLGEGVVIGNGAFTHCALPQ